MGWECSAEKGPLLGRRGWVGEVAWLAWEAAGAGGWVPGWEAGCSSAAVELWWFEPGVVWGSDWSVSNWRAV